MTRTCEFAGCEKDYFTTGLCSTHYQQRRRGKALTPVRQYRSRANDINGRECRACGIWKDWSHYYSENTPRTYCKECNRKLERKYQIARSSRQ